MKSASLHIRRIAARLDGYPLPHRLFLLAALLLLLFLVWQQFWGSSLLNRRRDLQAQLTNTRLRLTELQTQVEGVASGRLVSPDVVNRREKISLEQEIARLDGDLQNYTGNLLSPRQMASFLEDLLRQEDGLRLVRLENLGAEPLLAEGGGENASLLAAGANLYRHSLRLEFEGDYLRALAYLQRLEKMPKRLIWQELEIRAGEERARIVIVVQTLSLHRGWIGA